MKIVNLVSAAIMVLAVGCSTQQSTDPTPQASSTPPLTSAAPSPTVASLLDARWMGVTPDQPNGWEGISRTMTADFQQFDLRPVNETESMRPCNGCAPWTAVLTAYSPGKFDPTEARTGQPVSVDGDDEGFFRPRNDTKDAVVAWQYADNAWATAVGLTTTTSNEDQLVQLARALKPAERTPIRLPLTLANLPDDMPLAQIDVDTGAKTGGRPNYGTQMHFAPCGMTDNLATPPCFTEGNVLSVGVFPDNDYRHLHEERAAPIKVGGKDGLYDEELGTAAISVQPGLLVEFDVSGPGYPEGRASFERVLGDVSWAPDLGNEATWRPVTEWTK